MNREPVYTLLIEDNALFVKALSGLLEFAPCFEYKITDVRTLQEARPLLRDVPPGLILLDLNLPNGRGAAVVKEVRALAPNSCLIVLTGAEDEQLEIASMAAQVDDYLIKGEHDNHQTLRRIRNAVVRHRARKQVLALSEAVDRNSKIVESCEASKNLPPFDSITNAVDDTVLADQINRQKIRDSAQTKQDGGKANLGG